MSGGIGMERTVFSLQECLSLVEESGMPEYSSHFRGGRVLGLDFADRPRLRTIVRDCERMS